MENGKTAKKKGVKKDINYVRYKYYLDFYFYEFIAALGGVGAFFISILIEDIIFHKFPWSMILEYYQKSIIIDTGYYMKGIGAWALINLLFALILPDFILKFFFNQDKKILLKKSFYGFFANIFFTIAILSLNLGRWILLKEGGFILLVLSLLYILAPFIKTKKLIIYPNRIKIGNMVLFYKDFIKVHWGVGEINDVIRGLPASAKAKKIEILTPLLYESSGKDFTIYHYYVLIELPDIIYVVQSLFWRSSLVQNIRNGWIEEWRWDGSMEPPEDWSPPEK
ncbi:MAG: hypothetical protein ACTSU2_03670 [Promethearchaeota archaeon]